MLRCVVPSSRQIIYHSYRLLKPKAVQTIGLTAISFKDLQPPIVTCDVVGLMYPESGIISMLPIDLLVPTQTTIRKVLTRFRRTQILVATIITRW